MCCSLGSGAGSHGRSTATPRILEPSRSGHVEGTEEDGKEERASSVLSAWTSSLTNQNHPIHFILYFIIFNFYN